MPRAPKAPTTTATTVPSLDDLLENENIPTPEDATVEEKLTPEQEEIQRLRSELADEEKKAVLHPTTDTGRPLDESQLTPEQKEIRLLEDRLAAKRADNILKGDAEYESGDSVVTIHFIKDGLTAQGRVWVTGQTLAFGKQSYEQTKDRHGVSWLDYSDSEQYRNLGDIYFRRGAWEGATYDDDIANEDKKRGVAAPLVNI